MKHTKTAAISGAHGFIGKHLVTYLEKNGIHTEVIHRELLAEPRMLSTFFQHNKPSVIYHLAAYGNLHEQTNIQTIYQVNVMGLLNLLAASHALDYEAFINVSSSSVSLPVTTTYAASKLAAESLCKAWVDQYHKPIVSIRPYTVIGKGEHEQHLLPQLILSCKTGKTIPFVPHPTHDFIDVSDVVGAMHMLAKQATRYKGEIFEVGAGKKYTNLAVLNYVQELTGKKAHLEMVDSLRNYDNNHWMANTTALSMLGWKAKKTLQDSIKDMLKAYDK